MSETKIDKKKAQQQAIITIYNKTQQKVDKVIIPNGVQVGIESDADFAAGMMLNGPIKFTSNVIPSDTKTSLYLVDGALFFDGSAVGSGAAPTGRSLWTESAAGKIYTTGSVGVGSASAPKIGLSVTSDLSSWVSVLSDNESFGDVIKAGTGTLTDGALHAMKIDGSWTPANATRGSEGSNELLGVALGTSPTTDGLLASGYIRIDYLNLADTAVIGAPVYLSTTTGKYQFTAPSASGNSVRVIGYCVDYDSTSADILLKFKPSSTWVTIT